MARRIPSTTLVRQASAESFPHPRAPDQPQRRRNLSNAAVSNVNLWQFYNVPEVKAISTRISSGVERVNFRPCLNIEGANGDKCPPLIGEDGERAEGVSDSLAAACAEIWAQVQSPSGNQSDLFGSLATALTVAGDAWQFGYPGTPEMRWDPNGDPMWVGIARTAVNEKNELYEVEVGIDGCVKVPSNPEVEGHGTAIRIWHQDPRAPALADCWMNACIRPLQILTAIYEAVAAVALSRMNAGIILAPDDQDQLPIPTSALVNPGQFPLGTNLGQQLYDEIGDHVEESKNENDGWARATPAVFSMNSLLTDKVKWLELARTMDPQLGERIDDLRHRIFMVSPLPPEVAEGMATVSGLGGGNVADQIDKSEYQRAILPVCEDIAWPNTRHVLRAGLAERGFTTVEQMSVRIGYSAKNLLMPPDRSESAIRVAALDPTSVLLSPADIRESTGLGDFDPPTPEEEYRATVLWLAGKNPEYKTLLPSIGIDLPVETAADPAEVVDINRTEARALPAVRQAAASPDVGEQLVRIATRYESDLTVLFGAIIDRMAERASSRVASLSLKGSWADLRTSVQTTAAVTPGLIGVVPGVLPKLASEGVDDGDLFEPALTTFAPRFERLTRQHQKQAVTTAGAGWDDFEDQADEANVAAWALAGSLLIAEARYRFEGRLPEQTGEASVDPFGVPSGIVRRTSAVAGGDDDVAAGADPDRLSTSTLGTISTASLALKALEVAGRTIGSWTWDYREEIPRASYEEHLDLDGMEEPGSQPGDFDGYFPGDHRGCLCVLRPVTLLGEVGEGVEFG